MLRKWVIIVGVFVSLFVAGSRASADNRRQIIESLLKRSRYLENVHFRVPISVWEQYTRDKSYRRRKLPAPVTNIPMRGTYRMSISADGRVELAARVEMQVFGPVRVCNIPVFCDKFAWTDVRISGGRKAAKSRKINLDTRHGFLSYSPRKAGRYVFTARTMLKPLTGRRGVYVIPTCWTIRTSLRFDSTRAFDVIVADAGKLLTGNRTKGTHGLIPLALRGVLKITIRPPVIADDKVARYRLGGQVAWNFDVGRRQVDARLNVAILGGKTDRIDLTLPTGADRVRITGQDVREVRISAGVARVHLREKISGRTLLAVRFELPAAKGLASLGGFGVRDGCWSGGTLVITNTAGASEILAGRTTGLAELTLGGIPKAAAAILAGPAVMAYRITGRKWSIRADVINLGEFALRSTIADLAHYELVFRRDGTIVCKASYEIRNSNRQFLKLTLPAGAKVLLARVNEKSRPLTPIGKGEYLLPLVRSKASVMGLVSFPVEVVFMYRTAALGEKGKTELTLPRIDMPIAYAWCETYVPREMNVRRWAGPMKNVREYSSQTAVAQMNYGRGELADGYKVESRIKPDTTPLPVKTQPTSSFSIGGVVWDQSPLAKNYWRSGKEAYEQGDLDKARKSLEMTRKLSPKSSQAAKAEKLLANIRLTQGKMVLQSRSQKLSGAKVMRKIREGNRKLFDQQQVYLQQGFKAAREGKKQEARQQFDAADALSKQLIKRGDTYASQYGTMSLAWEWNARARARDDKTRKAQAKDELQEISKLKKQGRYDEALKKAVRLSNKGRLRFIFGVTEIRPDPMQKEIDELTVLAAKKRIIGEQAAIVNAVGRSKIIAREMERVYFDRAIKKSQRIQNRIQIPNRILMQKKLEQSLVISGEGRIASTGGGRYKYLPTTRPAQVDAGQYWITGLRSKSPLAQKREQMGIAKQQRRRRPERERIRKIDILTRRAKALIRQNKYKLAAEEVSRILAIDSRNSWAIEKRDMLADFLMVMEGSWDSPRQRQMRLKEIRRQEIPWYDLVRYPKNWKEISQRRKSAAVGTGSGKKASRAVSRVYDIRDILDGFPTSKQIGMTSIASGRISGGVMKPHDREVLAEKIIELLKETVVKDSWSDGATITMLNGQATRIVVTDSLDNQKQVAELLNQLREARGPAVEGESESIAIQRAEGIIKDSSVNVGGMSIPIGGTLLTGGMSSGNKNKELQEFIGRNYAWQKDRAKSLVTSTEMSSARPQSGGDGSWSYSSDSDKSLVDKLRLNLGQAVRVNSISMNNADAETAKALGIRFTAGNNDTRFATIDQAQFRTLMEMNARNRARKNGRADNSHSQYGVLGAWALLSDNKTINITYAGDKGNRLDLNDNPIYLPHGRYLLIDRSGSMTTVRTGMMQHWTQETDSFEFAQAPQDISPPRVGRQVRFEKTLVKPNDRLVIKAVYDWKGK